MLKFVCYPKCTTCQKAKKWLDDNGFEYELRDIKENNPTIAELNEWYDKSPLPLNKIFNTSGVLYKEMDLKNKLPYMSKHRSIELLATEGMLIKRPILVDGDTVLFGFNEADWERALKK